MQCPTCREDDNFVRRTYENFMEEVIVRRRFCTHCGHEFETKEVATKVPPKSWSKGFGKRK